MENQEFIKNRDPMEYLKIFFRRKWFFIAPVFLGLVISVIACSLLPPTYESSTVILVQEEKILNPLIQGLAVSTPVAARMQTLRELVLSWDSLANLIKRLNLAKSITSQTQYEALVSALRKDIFVSMRGPNLIRLSYRGATPETTLAVAKALTDNLIEENMRSQTKETDVAINFIKEQLQVYKRKIKEAQVADMQDNLDRLLMDSTDAHPMVKDLKDKINSAKKELETDTYEVTAQDKPIANPIYENIKQEIEKLSSSDPTASAAGSSLAYALNSNDSDKDPNVAIYKLMLMDKLDSVMARDIGVNENIYNMLLQKLETAKITQRLEASKEGTRYNIIDPPRMPLKPVKPNKIMVIFLGLFLGSFAGSGLVLTREFMDHSIIDIEDAKANLDLPILGAISRLITQDQVDKERISKKRIIITFVVLGVLAIMAVMLYTLFLR
jgi:succinoglycan biosynthesis transport protein ExoP